MVSNPIKPTTITRAGYEYQDLVGIEMLIRHYRDPELYDWVQLESDDSDFRSLDDVVAARKDGSYELIQVKFTVDPNRYFLDWDWLLKKSKNGTSMLQKWAESVARIAAMGTIRSASLITNRIPSSEFADCLNGTRVDISLLPQEIRESVEEACGGLHESESFLNIFDFKSGFPDLKRYEDTLRDQLVPTDVDLRGWLAFREYVRNSATWRNQPEPDGRILRQHVVQLITKRRPQAIRQDFLVPEEYSPPSNEFHQSILGRITDNSQPITIIWGTPGLGKSTYLSYLTQTLRSAGSVVVRHHYFLGSEDSSHNRTSFIDISTSIIEQLYQQNPEVMSGFGENIDKLRSAIEAAAENLSTEGKRLYLIIDGLDHVWRDTHRVDQLNHLFNELLPLPANVNLLVGTQRVSDEQLPGRLLTITKVDDWIEIPRMNEVTVHRWVAKQDEARPLILHFQPTPEQRVELIDEIAAAFFFISQGHPLHLIYAYEELIRPGRPIFVDDVRRLPPCPGGDIRTYYQGLWVRLSSDAKNILHMLAGSDFFWPGRGIRRVIGNFSQIAHLLEPRHVGMVPFHSSIFAWVRERPDHEESYEALLPEIINWLTNDAPEYWQWGWLWLSQARLGHFDDLLRGATRDWVVNSLIKGWPVRQIENILAKAEEKTFRDGDLDKTVSLRVLKTRVSNAQEYQSPDFAAYRATALVISDNQQQTLNLIDEIQSLTDREVTELARLCPIETRSLVRPICFNELARRINVWLELRHRPEREFVELSEGLVLVSALMNGEIVKRTIRFLQGFTSPTPYILRFIRFLGHARNIEGLEVVRETLSGPECQQIQDFVTESLIREVRFAGGDVSSYISSSDEPLSPFAACCFLWQDRGVQLQVHWPVIPSDLARDRYSFDDNEDIVSFLYSSFWTALYIGLCNDGMEFSIIYPGLKKGELGWLEKGLNILEVSAKAIAEGEETPTFSVLYTEAALLKAVKWIPKNQSDYYQYRAFTEALRRLSIDLHFLDLDRIGDSKIPASELNIARQSVHWSDELWVKHDITSQLPVLDSEGARNLLDNEIQVLLKNVTVFSERSERWTQLAGFALLYEDGRQIELLTHAAECLIGYGWRKDLRALDVLDAITELSPTNPSIAQERVDKIAPIIEAITEFTDGDETNHLRSDLIEVVGKVCTERLPALYEHHLLNDEYSYADDCLIEFAKFMEFGTSHGDALARTFMDDKTLSILERRAVDDASAYSLLGEQNFFLGRNPTVRNGDSLRSEGPSSQQPLEEVTVDATSFNSGDFAGLVKAGTAVHYQCRKEFLAGWLNHWKEEGQAIQALKSIHSYFEANEATGTAEGILDDAFLVALAIQGREAAYPWLVKAHTYGHGWESFFSAESKIMARLKLAAKHYADRWFKFIIDSSIPPPFYQRRGYSFVIGTKYLVRYLVLVGQIEVADRVTSALLNSLIEEVREQPIPEIPWFQQ